MPSELKTLLIACTALAGLGDPGTARKGPDLSSVLRRRLEQANEVVHLVELPVEDGQTPERRLQLLTADAALSALRRLHSLVSSSSFSQPIASTSTSTAGSAPVFGVKDTKALGMLAGIAGRWAVGLRLESGVLPPSFAVSPSRATSRFSEVCEDEELNVRKLADTLRALLDLTRTGKPNAEAESDTAGRRQLAVIIAPQILLPLLAGLVQFGHSPSSRQSDEGGWARGELERLCSTINPIVILSQLISMFPPSPTLSSSTWLRPAVSSLLFSVLLRPQGNGVRSLLLVVVGGGEAEGGADEVGMKKLEMLSSLLGAAPALSLGVSAETYFTSITNQLLAILTSASVSSLASSSPSHSSTTTPSRPTAPPPPPSILRASAYVLTHLLLSTSPAISSPVSAALLPRIHGHLLPGLYPPSSAPTPSPSAGEDENGIEIAPPLVPSARLLEGLTTLSLLLLHAPPLSSLHSTLLVPVLPSLLSLAAFSAPSTSGARAGKAVLLKKDERFHDEARGILLAWARSVGVKEGVKEVGRAVEVWESGRGFGGEGGECTRGWDEDGGVCVRRIRAGDLKESEAEEGIDAEAVVDWLKEVGRKELSSGLFLRWLDELQVLRKQSQAVGGLEAARRSLTRLQLVLKMLEELGSDGEGAENAGNGLLQEPEQIIAFVAHALEADNSTSAQVDEIPTPPPLKQKRKREKKEAKFGLASLRIVDSDEEEEEREIEREIEEKVQEMQEDEEEEPIVPGMGRDEMALTALTLLLAVLEGHEHLNMDNTPLLSLIYASLDRFSASETSEFVPPLAREAKMVLSLRRAAAFASAPPTTSSTATEDPLAASRSTYQEALKLLQDPLLPVRAQGLAMLKSLITTRSAFLTTDPALLPAVLDILVQALEDDDSFLYLSAIQGLSSMADVYGRQMVRRLVGAYRGGEATREAGQGEKGRRELDKRLRMGEALVGVVQRAGEALGMFVDDLLPTLLLVLRTSTLPTPLRSSALIILATAIETAPLALMPHADLLTEACLTLLSVESRPMQPRRREPTAPPTVSAEGSGSDNDEEDEPIQLGRDGKPKRPEETPDPVAHIDSKHPSLRRAAILFLGMLFRTASNLALEAAESNALAAGYDDASPLGAGGLRMPGGGSVGISTSRKVQGGGGGLTLVDREARERARTVLRYVSDTDEDSLVRHQAGQVLDELEGR